jgi:transglutaminase-like putative cysteine protease
VLVARRWSWRRWAFALSIAAIVLPPLTLLPYIVSGTEAVRARNSLDFVVASEADLDWPATKPPEDFDLESGPVDPFFAEQVRRMDLAALPTDWSRALAISRLLLQRAKPDEGVPILADLHTTYRRIISQGDGYCADFTRVFRALATAAGIPVRAWAFSFDGYGGHGHIWVEIWNRQAERWQLLDIYNNVYFVEGDSGPLSALDLRRALLAGSPTLQMRPLDPAARPGYVHPEKAWAYYRRGLDEWYLYWGNIPFTYENAWVVRTLGPVSRAAAQLGAVIQGIQPEPHLLATPANRATIAALQRLQWHIVAVVLVMLAGLLALPALLWLRLWRRQAEQRRLAA